MKLAWKFPLRALLITGLFAALVLALLWFQGILFRAEPELVTLPPARAVPQGARVARVERRVLPEVQLLPGFVEAIDPAELAPRVMAALLAVNAREGDAVVEGQELVVLDDRDARAALAQARSALEAARAGAVQAQLAFERAQRLSEAAAMTTQDLEGARAAHEAAAAQAERAQQAVVQAETALSWYRLAAPFGGRVLERHADPGQLATPGRALLTLYREDGLRFRVAIPEERASGLTPGAEFQLDFERLPSVGARLARVLPGADPGSGTVTLHLELPAAAGLVPGRLGRLRFAVGERVALLVPAGAIERIGQVERAQLVRDGRITLVTVRSGKAQGEFVEVLGGLAEGEEVLVR